MKELSTENVSDFFTSLGLPFEIIRGNASGWRTRAKLAVRGKAGKPLIGLFKPGTHEVEDLPESPDHHPKINHALATLRKEMIAAKIQPYDEKSLRGTLRYLQLSFERKSKRVQLVLVVNAGDLDRGIDTLIKKLSKDSIWHSIWVNFQPAATNRIFGDKWQLCYGETFLEEELGGNRVFYHPACFAQANPVLFDEMLHLLKEMVLPNKRVVEFYAGVGVIGLSIVSQATQLICTEINPFSMLCFNQAKAKLPLEFQKKISFQTLDADAALSLLEGAECVIVDPPRKGLEPELLKAICDSSSLEQLLYISCGWLSFKRDADALMAAGWIIAEAKGYLFFPRTDHIELLVNFKNKQRISHEIF